MNLTFNYIASLIPSAIVNFLTLDGLSKLLLQSENDSGMTLLLVVIGCLCGLTALIVSIVVVVMLVKKGKASSSYKSVFDQPDDHFSVMD